MGELKIVSSSEMQKRIGHEGLLRTVNPEVKFSFNIHRRLVVNNVGGFRIILFDHIRSLQSDSNYTSISLVNGEHVLVSKTLLFFSKQLDHSFLRTHKSYIVNLLCVSEYNKKENEIILDDNTRVPVARRKKAEVESYFQL